MPGHFQGHVFDIVSAFQVYGEYVSGSISDEHRMDVVRNSWPGAGACGGMYTANTMASAIEAMGMSLPYRYIFSFSDCLNISIPCLNISSVFLKLFYTC